MFKRIIKWIYENRPIITSKKELKMHVDIGSSIEKEKISMFLFWLMMQLIQIKDNTWDKDRVNYAISKIEKIIKYER